MTATQEQFKRIIPDMEQNASLVKDGDLQQIINLWNRIKPAAPKQEEPKRLKLGIADGKYKIPSDPDAYDDEIAEFFCV